MVKSSPIQGRSGSGHLTRCPSTSYLRPGSRSRRHQSPSPPWIHSGFRGFLGWLLVDTSTSYQHQAVEHPLLCL